MKRFRSDFWDELRAEIFSQIDLLIVKHRLEIPIDLGKIASLYGVTEIKFRPMLIEGALVEVGGGSCILVKSPQGESETLNRLFRESSSGATLPSHIASRARFSIAHEIAHILIARHKKEAAQINPRTSHYNRVSALERACNRIGAALLLPEIAVSQSVGEKSLHDTRVLRDLIKHAIVTRGVFVSRLRDFSGSVRPRAIILSVKANSERTIEAIWRYFAFGDMFSKIEKGSSLKSLMRFCDGIGDLSLLGGTKKIAEVNITLSTGVVEQWLSEEESSLDSESTVFVSLYRRDECF